MKNCSAHACVFQSWNKNSFTANPLHGRIFGQEILEIFCTFLLCLLDKNYAFWRFFTVSADETWTSVQMFQRTSFCPLTFKEKKQTSQRSMKKQLRSVYFHYIQHMETPSSYAFAAQGSQTSIWNKPNSSEEQHTHTRATWTVTLPRCWSEVGALQPGTWQQNSNCSQLTVITFGIT